jgi:negative regulator of sigma E activity
MTDDLERRLRQALHREAERITPHERRTEILAMANDDTETVQSPRRWLIPVAAAASVALIGAAVWGVSNSGGNQQATRTTTHPATSTTSGPSTAAVPVPSPASTVATTPVTLPAYFVGATTAAGAPYGLYREFVRTDVPVGATTAQKAQAAVAVAMNAQPLTNYEPYVQPWSGTSVKDVTVTPSLITITLSGPGATGFTAEQSRLAVQELVWTAQAAVGQGTIPVKFAVADGSPTLFGTYPTAQTYNRPAPELQYQVLAPIWITSPVRDQSFTAGATVVASGQSCAFEGTTQWQLKKGGTAVRSGSATASSGCPTRGTWQVGLGTLTAGSYTFRMYEVSMQNGKVIAETSRPFSVK